MISKNLKALIAAAAETDDHTKVQEFKERTLPRVGKTMARFIGYVEYGLHARKPYNGKPKDPAEAVSLSFELLSKQNIRTIEKEGGESFTVTDKIHIPLTKSLSKKANYLKIFEEMLYGRQDIKHIAQMLGEAFIVTVSHGKGNDGKMYANIDLIEPPFVDDPETGKRKTYTVPAPMTDLRVFLFKTPTQESWDSLFIDKEGKNFIQEKIMKALNFKGSPLDEMLAGGITTHVDKETVDEVEEDTITLDDDEEPVTPVKVANKAMKKVAAVAPVKLNTSMLTNPKPTGKKQIAKASVKAVVAKKAVTKSSDPYAELNL